MNKLDLWWSSLAISEKERIAAKAAQKEGKENVNVQYPACTTWWNSVEEDRKQSIYAHCTDKHGLLLPEWKEGKTLSY